MGSLSQAKTLGGVGAILMIVGGFVPYAGFIITIIGLIMVFLGVKNISEAVSDPQIKSDFIMFVVFSIIAAIVIALIPLVVIGGAAVGVSSFATSGNPMDAIGAAIAVCVVMLIIAFVFYILSAVYLKKSFERITERTRVDLFKTTGLIYLIGAILTIVIVGIFLMWIAYILMIVAFFSLPDTLGPATGPTGSYPTAPQGQQPPQQQVPPQRVCPGCGRSIPPDAMVSPYCGKKFTP